MLHAFDASALRFPGFFVQHVGAASAVTSAADDHAWIEVMRIARLDDREDAIEPNETCTVGQVWFWAAPGSGVWLNVGRSLVARGDAARPGCREAHAQGYDTIQMPAAMGGFSSELMDCRGAATTIVSRRETPRTAASRVEAGVARRRADDSPVALAERRAFAQIGFPNRTFVLGSHTGRTNR